MTPGSKKDFLDESYFDNMQAESPVKNVQLYESERFSKTASKRDELFLNVQPPSVNSRKKSFHTLFGSSDIGRGKDFLLEMVRKDHGNWRKECYHKQFSKFFRD